MAENSKIQWTTHTFNPWRGCTKVAAGCANCYAETMSKRNQKTLGIWGPNGTRVVASEAMWREPGKWDKAAFSASREHERSHMANLPTMPTPLARPRVFCASLADVFEDWRGEILDSSGRRLYLRADEDVRVWSKSGSVWTTDSTINEYPFSVPALEMGDVRARLVKLWDATPNLDWLVLTKRPENIRRMLHDHWTEKVAGHVSQNEGDGRRWKKRENVWLGTSIACQEDADRNIPELLKCRDLAANLFLSIEPLVGPVNLSHWMGGRSCRGHGDDPDKLEQCETGCDYDPPSVDWVIIGGESGPNARPCNIDWIRNIVNQCKEAGVSCFVKQLGAVCTSDCGCAECWNVAPTGFTPHGNGLRIELRDTKGGDPNEWPEDLRVREIPAS